MAHRTYSVDEVRAMAGKPPRESVPAVMMRLPWPPSMNHYWRRVGAKTLISQEGREYRTTIGHLVRSQGVGCVKGRLAVTIYAYPPDRRVRDLDNLLKPLLDALASAGVYENDGAIDCLHIVRGSVKADGEIRVIVQQVEAALA